MTMPRTPFTICIAFLIAAAAGLCSGCGRHSTDSSGALPQVQDQNHDASAKSSPAIQPSDAAKLTEPAKPCLSVFAGVPPLAFLVEQIGRERVTVGVLVQSNQDPHTFDPTPQQIVALSRAKVFFQVGMPFENILLDKIKKTHARLVIVDVTDGIPKRHMDATCAHDPSGLGASANLHATEGAFPTQTLHADSGGEAGHGDHDHAEGHADAACVGNPDPHVWLSPLLLSRMARNIDAALARVDAASAAFYAENLNALLDRIDRVHQQITRQLEPYRGRAFYVFHPGFGYFADAYGLKQIAVEAGGRSPSPKQMQALIRQAREERVRVIFVQPQSPQQSARVIADAVGAKVVTINGLAKDVLADTEDIAAKIELALSDQSMP